MLEVVGSSQKEVIFKNLLVNFWSTTVINWLKKIDHSSQSKIYK